MMKSIFYLLFKRGDYIYKTFDHIAYRYEIQEYLGNGSFG